MNVLLDRGRLGSIEEIDARMDEVAAKISDGIPVECPNCAATPFVTFLRGQVVRSSRPWYWPFKARPRYCIICYDCKEVVGYEWDEVIDFMGMGHLSQEDAKIALVDHRAG